MLVQKNSCEIKSLRDFHTLWSKM